MVYWVNVLEPYQLNSSKMVKKLGTLNHPRLSQISPVLQNLSPHEGADKIINKEIIRMEKEKYQESKNEEKPGILATSFTLLIVICLSILMVAGTAFLVRLMWG